MGCLLGIPPSAGEEDCMLILCTKCHLPPSSDPCSEGFHVYVYK